MRNARRCWGLGVFGQALVNRFQKLVRYRALATLRVVRRHREAVCSRRDIGQCRLHGTARRRMDELQNLTKRPACPRSLGRAVNSVAGQIGKWRGVVGIGGRSVPHQSN